jgi:hypothetical protein
MLHQEQLHISITEFQKINEERLYKRMVHNMIDFIPMHELKKFFPLEISELDQGYNMRIKIEIT